MDSNSLYSPVIWAMSKDVSELRDILIALGMDSDLAVATLERLLPENIVYKLEED